MLIFELPGLHGFSRRVPVVGCITAAPLVAPVLRCCLSLIVIMQHQPKPETPIHQAYHVISSAVFHTNCSIPQFSYSLGYVPTIVQDVFIGLHRYIISKNDFNSFSVRKHPTKPHRHGKATIVMRKVRRVRKEGNRLKRGKILCLLSFIILT
jgi:hypothetical protein